MVCTTRGSSWLTGVSCMSATRGSILPNERVPTSSLARAVDRPRSWATPAPTLATSMPRPTSARNSRRLRSLMASLLGGIGTSPPVTLAHRTGNREPFAMPCLYHTATVFASASKVKETPDVAAHHELFLFRRQFEQADLEQL